MVSFVFIYTEIITLVHKHDVDIMSALEEDAISDDYKFGADNGFFMAAALIEFDSGEKIVEEERYGELVIEQYGWGYTN